MYDPTVVDPDKPNVLFGDQKFRRIADLLIVEERKLQLDGNEKREKFEVTKKLLWL